VRGRKGWLEPHTTAGKVNCGVKGLNTACSKLAAAQEGWDSEADSGDVVDGARRGWRGMKGNELAKDGEGNREFRLPVFLPHVPLNTPDHPLEQR
jgi:hypothetical protein